MVPIKYLIRNKNAQKREFDLDFVCSISTSGPVQLTLFNSWEKYRASSINLASLKRYAKTDFDNQSVHHRKRQSKMNQILMTMPIWRQILIKHHQPHQKIITGMDTTKYTIVTLTSIHHISPHFTAFYRGINRIGVYFFIFLSRKMLCYFIKMCRSMARDDKNHKNVSFWDP